MQADTPMSPSPTLPLPPKTTTKQQLIKNNNSGIPGNSSQVKKFFIPAKENAGVTHNTKDSVKD